MIQQLMIETQHLIPEGYIYFSKYRKVINKRSAIVVCLTMTRDSGLFNTLVIASLDIMKVIFDQITWWKVFRIYKHLKICEYTYS